MNKRTGALLAVTALLVVLGGYFIARVDFAPRDLAETSEPPVQLSEFVDRDGRYMFAVTLHTPEAIDGLLTRAEQLRAELPITDERAGIALVLHGPEVEYFASKNYGRYKPLVDKAARLDADGIIDIKICRTQMRHLGIKNEEIPDFVELVPFGPDEIRRLERSGYVYL